MSKIGTREEYFQSFPEKIRKEALKNILEIRKFEIELYWKRATYFWAFIGATFAGYVTILNSNTPNDKSLFAIILLGIVFSLAWYFVNRGSKFWQLNWEKHLDVMEDEIIGPLYKTTIERAYYMSRWYVLNAPYPFSVSKINILLSLFVFVLWVGILIEFIIMNPTYFTIRCLESLNYYGITSLIAVVFTVSLLVWGRTGKGKTDQLNTHIHFDSRALTEEAGASDD